MAPASHDKPQSGGDESPSAGAKATAQVASTNSDSSMTSPSADPASATWVGNNMAQALRDLARGEQTATALEASLTNLENKLDDILASFGVLPEEDEDATAREMIGENGEKGEEDESKKSQTARE